MTAVSGRGLAILLAAVLLAAAAAGGENAASRARITWPIPAVAWRAPIGETAYGVPLGGFGAGSFMLNTEGTFGPWHFQPGKPEPGRRLRGAAFHFYEKPAEGEATVATLTASPAMPGWGALPSRGGRYHALYPKGWFTYRAFTSDLSLKFFSPILRGVARETSLPVAVFEFEIANPTDKPLDAAVMFTWPNVPGHTRRLRSGFQTRVERDEPNAIAAVVLDARYERNHPAEEDAEWCIAVRAEKGGRVSFATSWNAMASGGDILGEFADDGRLPNDALDGTQSAAAVAFKASLEPGAIITVPFALAWDFPRVAFDQTAWWRRYTEFRGREGNAAHGLARDALLRHGEWEAGIDAWTRPVLDHAAYPDWLKQAALNELYYNSFGGVFWEAGCITRPEEFKGLHPDDHKYFALASSAEPQAEPLALRHGAHRQLLHLWPAIETAVLVSYADAIMDAENGLVHDLGSAAANPLLTYNATENVPAGAFDLAALFLLQAHACHKATEDAAFLEALWPACKKSLEALVRAAGDQPLPQHAGETLPSAPVPLRGVSLLGGGLYVAALDAARRLATAQGDEETAKAAAQRHERAANALNRSLWREQEQFYTMDSEPVAGETLAAGALLGVRAAQAGGLRPVLPPDRVRAHLSRVFERAVKPLRDSTGDGVGDCGAVNTVGREGKPLVVGRGGDVSAAATYQLAATMYEAGRAVDDSELMDQALKTAHGAYYQTWVVAPDKPLWAFNSPQGWAAERPARARSPQHMAPRAIWDLLLAIADPYAAAPRKE
jgi:uncharacterized protein (DUF608 family)